MLKERDFLHKQWSFFEKAFMLKSPVMEAEYAHDERTPLSLYDCLIPTLREHRMLHLRPRSNQFQIEEDFRARIEVIKLE